MDCFNTRGMAVSILALGDVASCRDPRRAQRPLEPIETAMPLIAVNISILAQKLKSRRYV